VASPKALERRGDRFRLTSSARLKRSFLLNNQKTEQISRVVGGPV
jgi:hypothetical protein